MAALAGLDIGAFKTCIHAVDLDADCATCPTLKERPKTDRGYGYMRYRIPGYKDEATGRWLAFGDTDEYVPCPHGVLIQLVKGRLPTVTKLRTFCEACEVQRAEGLARDAEIEALLARQVT